VAQQVRRTICCQFTVPTLEYLRRGGRVSRGQEMVGTLLGVRPVMGFEDGRIRVERTVRQGQALQDIIRTLEERFGREPISISVAHGGRDPGRMAELRAAVERSRLNPVRRRVQLVGATIGAHVGPGFYGVSALPLSVTERVIGGCGPITTACGAWAVTELGAHGALGKRENSPGNGERRHLPGSGAQPLSWGS